MYFFPMTTFQIRRKSSANKAENNHVYSIALNNDPLRKPVTIAYELHTFKQHKNIRESEIYFAR